MNLRRITQHPLCCNSHANWKNLRRSWIFGKCGYCFGRSKLMGIEVASTASSHRKISRQHSIQPLSKYFYLSISFTYQYKVDRTLCKFFAVGTFCIPNLCRFCRVPKAAALVCDVSETTANSDKPLTYSQSACPLSTILRLMYKLSEYRQT